MVSHQLLSRAPIAEAILDVRVRARRDLQASEFLAVAETLREDYPAREDRRGIRAHIEIAEGSTRDAHTTDLGIQGYFFKSSDGLDIAQFRVDGFTLNRLKPYTSWEAWFPRFAQLWQLYAAIARPEGVTRIATRCINHIAIPAVGASLDRYLTHPPTVPEGMPGTLSDFITSVALLDSARPGVGLTLTQSLEAQGPDGSPRLTIDLDAFETCDFLADEILDRFGALRTLRDDAFFGSITEHTKGMFQ